MCLATTSGVKEPLNGVKEFICNKPMVLEYLWKDEFDIS